MNIAFATPDPHTNTEEPQAAICVTPSCIAFVAAYGALCNDVYRLKPLDLVPSALEAAAYHCARCGGYSDGERWVHECKSCRATVEPGLLYGPAQPVFCASCALKPGYGLRSWCDFPE